MAAKTSAAVTAARAAEAGMAAKGAVLRTAAVVGVSTGLYGIAFGALAGSAGLSVSQATLMSLLVFTGGSQFVAVGVLSGGGSPATALGAAWLLGARNAFYGLRIAPVIGPGVARRLLAAQWTVDESTAVASAQPTRSAAALGFWSTGLAVCLLWTAGTALGAGGAATLSSPAQFGLDAASPAAFVAFLAPQLKSAPVRRVCVASALVCLLLVPMAPAGVPILAAALPPLAYAAWTAR